MVFMDSGNNRIIQDGNSVMVGDQVLIDIKTTRKGLLSITIYLFDLKINYR